jgi:hypothetical protein
MQTFAKGRFDRWAALRSLLLALLLPLCVSVRDAAADPDPSNDSDALTLSVTPVIDIGVDIDTGAVSLDFTLQAGATDYTLRPTTVTVLGNFKFQELELSAQNLTASPNWSLDEDEAAQADQLQLYALFSVDRSSRPLEAEFSGVKNLLTGAPKRAGFAGSDGPNGNFENNQMTGAADMDRMMPTSQRQLWFRLDTPPISSTDEQQRIQIVITVTKNNL